MSQQADNVRENNNSNYNHFPLYSNVQTAGDARYESLAAEIRILVTYIDDGTLDLSPNYQRDYCWGNLVKNTKTSHPNKFIEDILGLNETGKAVDFGVIKINQRGGIQRVTDGKQRLTTIHAFAKNKFPLVHNGYKYYYDNIPDDATGPKNVGILPPHLKTMFNRTKIAYFLYNELSDRDERLLFETTNRGVPLTMIEKFMAMETDMNTYLKDNIFVQEFLDPFQQFKLKTKRFAAHGLLMRVVFFCQNGFDLADVTTPSEISLRNFLHSEVNFDVNPVVFLRRFLTIAESSLISYAKEKKVSKDMLFDMLFLFSKYSDASNRELINMMNITVKYIAEQKSDSNSKYQGLSRQDAKKSIQGRVELCDTNYREVLLRTRQMSMPNKKQKTI